MATLKQLQLPDELLHSIERRAAAQDITIQEQVVRDLSLAEKGPRDVDEKALLVLIRKEREEMAARGVYLTDELLREAKNWGRK
jgi:hypothetical protein